ncbi:MAG: hypothetical protein ACJ71U_00260 [Terriglobales bacterium]
MSKRANILAGLAAEIALAILPLLVVLLAAIHFNAMHHLFRSPEWSFGSAVIFGQLLVKVIAAIAKRQSAAPGPVSFVAALVLVLGLVPSLFILFVMLGYSMRNCEAPVWASALQVVLFLGSATAYLLLGTVNEEWTG